jgi:hypothetical protein
MSAFSAFRRLLLSIVAILSMATSAAADPPDVLRNYRFIPSRSTVDVTGGLAGFDMTLNIRGRFGLVTGYRHEITPGPQPPTLDPFVKFVDVKAILYNPLSLAPWPSPGWDLDDTLNLSGLNGSFQLGDPAHLFFRGVDGQGQPIKLAAVRRGPLLYLRGANDPGCCDFFKYEVSALAHLAPYADFNLDGRIDKLDADTISANFGLAGEAAFEQGDADGDGDVDGGDFIVWQTGIGQGIDVNALALATASQFSAVPEPTSAALFIFAVLAAVIRRRR